VSWIGAGEEGEVVEEVCVIVGVYEVIGSIYGADKES
jgi:hypothetical protein